MSKIKSPNKCVPLIVQIHDAIDIGKFIMRYMERRGTNITMTVLQQYLVLCWIRYYEMTGLYLFYNDIWKLQGLIIVPDVHNNYLEIVRETYCRDMLQEDVLSKIINSMEDEIDLNKKIYEVLGNPSDGPILRSYMIDRIESYKI